jgi:hypothetical protein
MTAPAAERSTPVAAYAIVRDIARGGLAGLVAGLVVAGVGGRIAMRVAALLVPAASGQFTENGNRIGEITVGGSLALIVFVGLLAAVAFGVAWVVVSPWLPRSTLGRGLVPIPAAIALGAFGLVNGTNPDFDVLGHDPRVVGALLALIALIPPVLALVDRWLEARLPHADDVESGAMRGYLLLVVTGAILGGLLIAPMLVDRRSQPFAATVLVLGVLTLLWWRERLAGRAEPSGWLTSAARAVLVGGTVVGFAVLWDDLSAALAIR